MKKKKKQEKNGFAVCFISFSVFRVSWQEKFNNEWKGPWQKQSTETSYIFLVSTYMANHVIS